MYYVPTGRAVMLEQPRKTLPRTISHILASHGGEIYIHALTVARSILEDPPSISEGCGGRVTDYRITVSWSMDGRLTSCFITSERKIK